MVRPTEAAQPGSTAAIVLTGGASRRMGRDKASLVVDGQAMAEHVSSVARAGGVTVIVFAGSDAVPDLADAESEPGVPRQGPLAGVVAGWRYLGEQLPEQRGPTLVLSCDLPRLEARVVRELIAACSEAELGAVAHDGERRQPLIGCYQPVALDRMAAAFAAGERSVRKCFAPGDLLEVPFDPHVLRDADTPQDLDGFDVRW